MKAILWTAIDRATGRRVALGMGSPTGIAWDRARYTRLRATTRGDA